MNQCEHIAMYVSVAAMHIRRSFDSCFTKYGCTSGMQCRVLGELAKAENEQRDIYQKDVEKIFGIRRSSVNSLISNLEHHGLICRIQDPVDARLKKLSLTDSGRQLHETICQDIEQFESALSSEFSPEEQAQLIAMMKRIIDHCTLSDTDQITTRKESKHV